MAKQIGYTDAELEAIKEEEKRIGFAPEVRVALKFAELMAADAHVVSDDDFAELRKYYSEAEIVEMASVIGLTAYFNRFNTVFRVDHTGTNAPYES